MYVDPNHRWARPAHYPRPSNLLFTDPPFHNKGFFFFGNNPITRDTFVFDTKVGSDLMQAPTRVVNIP